MRKATGIPLTSSAAWRLGATLAWLVTAVAAGVLVSPGVRAQDAVPTLRTNAELEELVGPIALYPDDLVALVLPASTYPLQVVQAARFLEDRKSNPNLQPDPEWDDSIVALLNYPEVLALLNDDLDWTWSLGEAVLDQRAQVLDAIQRFRDRAYAAGNLRTDERQVVNQDAGVIAIEPADPEVIYVPYYEPERVVVYQPVPVYHYHPWTYPVYYYPYPVGYSFFSFRAGFFWGVTTAFAIGWHDHFVHVRPWGYHRHPYYGWRYHDPYYVRHGVNINVHINRSNYVWEPHYRRAAQPLARSVGRRVNDGAYQDPRRRDAYGYRTQTGPVTRSFARDPNAQTPARNAGSTAQPRQYRAQGQAQAAEQRGTLRQAAPSASAEPQTRQYRAQGQAQALRQRGAQPQTTPSAREQQAQIPSTQRLARGGPNAALRERPSTGAVAQPTPQRAVPSTGAPTTQRAAPPTRSTLGGVAQRSTAAPRATAPQYRGGGMAQARESARSGSSAAAIARAPARAPAASASSAPRAGGSAAPSSGGSSYRSGAPSSSSSSRSAGHAVQRRER